MGSGKFAIKVRVAGCDCREKLEGEELVRKKKAEFERYIDSQIPSRFRGCRLEGLKARNKSQAVAYSRILAKPEGSFLIVGPYASGKTHLLFAQFRRQVETGNRAYARTTYELVEELRRHELGERFSDMLLDVRDRRRFHLFWDDADKIKVTEWKMEALFGLVDAIYRNEMGLTLTSNTTVDELQEKLDPAIVRRIDDLCELIEVQGSW